MFLLWDDETKWVKNSMTGGKVGMNKTNTGPLGSWHLGRVNWPLLS